MDASRKIVRRLIPFLMLCYFAAYLDRVNVGFAALTMNADLGLSAEMFGFGAGIFFPGIILVMTYWFTAEERARWIGMFMTAIPLSSVIGGPISGWILDHLNGALGVEGWRWLFVLEGLPSVAVGLACFAWLDDGPAAAAWLTPVEREVLASRLAAERR